MMSSIAASGTPTGGYRAWPVSRATAPASVPGSRPAMMSLSRWQQEIPAACMNVARPISAAVSASQGSRVAVRRERDGCPRR
jgi:hypothetical protein